MKKRAPSLKIKNSLFTKKLSYCSIRKQFAKSKTVLSNCIGLKSGLERFKELRYYVSEATKFTRKWSTIYETTARLGKDG
jgi:hypothetical protein